MQGDVRLVADDPAIVAGRDVKERAGTEFVDGAVVHCSGGATGKNQPNMLDVAARRSYGWADMRGPFPSRLVSGAADGHIADVNDLELSFLEGANFVRLLKTLQDRINGWHSSISES